MTTSPPPPVGAPPSAPTMPPPPMAPPGFPPPPMDMRRIGDAPSAARGGAPASFVVQKGPAEGPQRVVIYGAGGIGKTSLAALLPKPLFIDLEDGSRELDVSRIPRASVPGWDALRALLHSKETIAPYQTIVVDSATKAQEMAGAWTVANVPDEKGMRVDSLEKYGYGKGFQYLSDTFLFLLQDLDDIVRQGKDVVLIAHDVAFTVPNPNGEDFLKYGPDLYAPKEGGKASVRNRVVQWADHVLWIGYDLMVGKDGVARGSGSRRIYPTELPWCLAKTRRAFDPIEYVRGDDSVWRALRMLA